MNMPLGKVTFKYIKVPVEALEQSGIDNTKPLEFYVHEGTLIIKNITDTGSFACDKDCNSCPFEEFDCNIERTI